MIITVLNESESLDRLLESLCDQTRRPDAVVVADGGSTDDTLQRLRTWGASGRLPLEIRSEPGSNISRGRNVAIAACRQELVACADAGVRLGATWLEHLLRPLQVEGGASVVACGFFLPEALTVFETSLGATVLPALEDIRPERFLPSSRSVAFSRSAWQAVGGYPEWLDYCEDLVFDLRLKARGYRFVFVPDAIVHFRPRPDLWSFAKQYFRYARGDGKADLWRLRHLVRYGAYLVVLPALLWLALRVSPGWLTLLGIGAAAMLYTPYKRLWPEMSALSPLQRLQAVCWVPAIRVTGDVAKMLGYPVGRLWRWRNRLSIPDWRRQET